MIDQYSKDLQQALQVLYPRPDVFPEDKYIQHDLVHFSYSKERILAIIWSKYNTRLLEYNAGHTKYSTFIGRLLDDSRDAEGYKAWSRVCTLIDDTGKEYQQAYYKINPTGRPATLRAFSQDELGLKPEDKQSIPLLDF